MMLPPTMGRLYHRPNRSLVTEWAGSRPKLSTWMAMRERELGGRLWEPTESLQVPGSS